MTNYIEPNNRHKYLIINDDIVPLDSSDIYHFFDNNSIAEIKEIRFYKHLESEHNVETDKYYPSGYAIINIDYWFDTNNSNSFYNSLLNYHTIKNKENNVFIFRSNNVGPPWNVELYCNWSKIKNFEDNDFNNKKQKTYHKQDEEEDIKQEQEELNQNHEYVKQEQEELNQNHEYVKQEQEEEQEEEYYEDNTYDDNDDNDDDDNDDDDDEYQYNEEDEHDDELEDEQNDNFNKFITLKKNYSIISKKYYNLLAVNHSLVKRNKDLSKASKKLKNSKNFSKNHKKNIVNITSNTNNVWTRRLRSAKF